MARPRPRVLVVLTRQPPIARAWGDEGVVSDVVCVLRSVGMDVVVGRADRRSELDGLVGATGPDLAMPNGYWLLAEPGRCSLPGALVGMGVPTVGADDVALVTTSKREIKERLDAGGVPTPRWVASDPGEPIPPLGHLGRPLVIKPDHGAESIDTWRVEDPEEIPSLVGRLHESHEQTIIIEEWRRCREYTVGVLGNGAARHVLPLEIRLPGGLHFLSTEAKKRHMEETVRPVADGARRDVEDLTHRVCDALGVRDWVRMELLEDPHGELWAIDVNFMPGLRRPENPSYLPLCARHGLGLTREETILAVVHEALRRTGLRVPEAMLAALEGYRAARPAALWG